MLDVSASTGPLAEAAARLSRILPARSSPGHAEVLLRADGTGVLLAATDGELSGQFHVPASVHEPGEVVVSRRGLAETLAGLDVPEVRLVVQGQRLAVRVPGARFALPRIGGDPPAPPPLPAVVGEIAGAALRAAAVSV